MIVFKKIILILVKLNYSLTMFSELPIYLIVGIVIYLYFTFHQAPLRQLDIFSLYMYTKQVKIAWVMYKRSRYAFLIIIAAYMFKTDWYIPLICILVSFLLTVIINWIFSFVGLTEKAGVGLYEEMTFGNWFLRASIYIVPLSLVYLIIMWFLG